MSKEGHMSTDPPDRSPGPDAEFEREVRADHKFSLAEAIGRMGGPGMMKGISPVTRKQQAEAAIRTCLGKHLPDSQGALTGTLLRQVGESAALLEDMDRPLVVLARHVRSVLGSEYLLKELVREADAEWGRVFMERPHFEREGRPSDPNDPYTTESVRAALSHLLGTLNEEGA
jgi:hypothetical protein